MLVDSAAPARLLLAWYDRHRRTLPWRALPGAPAADPYRVWLSEIMLQQTTVAAVRGYFETFTRRWPTVAALAAAPEAEVMAAWAGLGYYARARNLVACARLVAGAHRGIFPDTVAGLRALPGIGAYTAAAIAAIAFDRPAAVVDANVERVVARLFALATPLPRARAEIAALTATITPAARPGDFAQAMMDLGAMVCTPRRPTCALCPLADACAGFAAGAAEAFPVKPARPDRPVRRATIFWLEHDRHVLLVRRAPKGMLGGMRALPSGPWTAEDPGLAEAPAAAGGAGAAGWQAADWQAADWQAADWQAAGGGRHVFTHFALDYRVVAATAIATPTATTDAHGAEAEGGAWWPLDRLDEAGLPTLFARAATLALNRNAS